MSDPFPYTVFAGTPKPNEHGDYVAVTEKLFAYIDHMASMDSVSRLWKNERESPKVET